MKRFKFRLDAVKRTRIVLEEEAMADLARALGQVREVEARLQVVAAERDEVLGRIDAGLGAQNLDVAWIERHHMDLARLDEAEERARNDLVAARAAYDEARTRLTERRADRKAMDVLEDKARMRHDEETRREEHVAMDDIAMQRYERRSRERQKS